MKKKQLLVLNAMRKVAICCLVMTLLVLTGLQANAQYTMQGICARSGNIFNLAAVSESPYAGRFWKNTKIDLNNDFTLDFNLMLGSPFNNGVAFVLQRSSLTPPLVLNTDNIHNFGTGSINSDFVVEFDIRGSFCASGQNTSYEPVTDINHISYWKNNSACVFGNYTSPYTALGTVDYYNFQPYKIKWIKSSNTLQTYFNNVLLKSDIVDLIGILGGSDVWWGFSSGCYCIANYPQVQIIDPVATLTTTAASSITASGFASGGDITSDGGDPVTARGVAYGTSAAPLASSTATSDGTGTGLFTSTITGLSANTQYFYRAYATNNTNTSYGDENSFYTLANTPVAPVLNNATTTTMDIAIGNGDNNPITTEYAILFEGGSYLQANGTIGSTPVWQTAAAWGTTTIHDFIIVSNGNYDFEVKARNIAGVETPMGPFAALTTLAITPAAPTVNGATSSSLNVTINPNGNGAFTPFAIHETTTNKYVQANGALGSSPVWQTVSAWGTKTVTGLSASTLYTFETKAINQDNVETAFGPSTTASTNCVAFVHNLNTGQNYCSIQAAINDPLTLNTHVISIDAGVYAEDIVITKELEIKGASALTTTIIPATSNSNTGGGSLGGTNVFLIQANNVKIHDLGIDGDNPLLTSGQSFGGADIDARNGIITNHDAGVYTNLEVYNTNAKNIFLRGIYQSSGGTFNFHDNTVTNVQADPGSIALFAFGSSGVFDHNTVSNASDAISANNSKGIVFSNNTVTNSGSGVHSDNNGSEGGTADEIFGNNVSNSTSGGYGIWVFAPYRDVWVHENKVTNVDVGMAMAGQQIAVTPVFEKNEIDGQNKVNSTGMYVTTSLFGFGSSNVSVSFNNNIVKNNIASGFVLESENGQALTINAHENAVTGNSPLAVQEGFGSSSGFGTITTDMTCNWWGTTIYPDIVAAIPASVNYIPYLANGTDNDLVVNGFQPIAGSCTGHPTEYFVNDNNSTGDVYTTAVGNDANPGTAAAPFATIQHAISVATAGVTIYVDAGTYQEQLVINKSLTIIGADRSGAHQTTIKAPATLNTISNANASDHRPVVYASGIGNTVDISKVNIDGDGRGGARFYGVYYFEASGTFADSRIAKIRDASFSGVQSGQAFFANHTFDTDVSQTVTVTNNIIEDYQKTGILINELNTHGIVTNNIVTGQNTQHVNGENGIQFGYGAYGTITGNTVSNNLYNGPSADAAGGILLVGVGVDFTNTPTGNTTTVGNNTLNGNEVGLFTDAGGFGYDANANVTYNANTFTNSYIHVSNSSPATVPNPANIYDKRVDNLALTNIVYGRIQRAIDGASAGNILNVSANTFAEDVTVTEEVEIKGQGALSTTVIPATSNSNTGGGSLGGTNVFLIQANNVKIHDLGIDGDNPLLTSGQSFGGADIDARNGIITDHNTGVYTNLEVYNMNVKNIFLRGIYQSSGGTFNFHDNTVTNVQADPGSIALFAFGSSGVFDHNTVSNANDAISANNSTGIVFSNNTVTNSSSGIHSDNNGSGGGVADEIFGNNVSNSTSDGYGIWVFAPYRNILVHDNKVTNVDVGMAAAGQQAAVTPVFTSNEIDGQNKPGSAGMYVTTSLFGFGSSNVSVSFNNNIVKNNDDGFYLESEAGQTLTINAHKNSITGNSNFAVEEGTGASGAGTFTTDMTCNWWGTVVSASIASSISGTINFTPHLINGTDADLVTTGFQTNEVCATCALLLTATSTAATCPSLNNGTATVGVSGGSGNYTYSWTSSPVQTTQTATGLTAGNYTVTVTDMNGCTATTTVSVSNSTVAGPVHNITTGLNYCTIQSAINDPLTLDNHTITVDVGTYDEDVTVTKSLKITGAGAATTTIRGVFNGSGSTVAVAANNVELSGFTITRLGNNTADWNDANGTLNLVGISVQGQSITGMLIHDNIITGNRTGIDINNSNGHTIRNNIIADNRTGLIFRNQTDNITFTENEVTNNWTVGILFLDGSGGTNNPVQTAANCNFFNNNISGNWYGQIVDRQTGGSLPAPGGSLKNFSGNWFGTITPVVTTANTTEPGYATQIPVEFGGSAAAPGGQPDMAGPASANFDYTPYLNSGTDVNIETVSGRGTFGFQGDFSNLWVTTASIQTGITTRIQEGVNLVKSAGTVNVTAGTYNENVVIGTPLTLQGAGNTTILTPATSCSGTGITINANNTTIKNLKVTNYVNGITVAASTIELNTIESVSNCTTGIEMGNGINGLTVKNSKINNNSVGFRAGTGAQMSNITIDNDEVKGNVQGMFIAASTGGSNLFDNIAIRNSDFSNNTQKGMYFEKLSHAVIDNIIMDNSGNDATYNTNCGIDINLKYGNYSNVTIKNSSITNSGAFGTATDVEAPAAIAVKARDDAPSYNSSPATLDNVTIINNFIKGPQNGLRFGEFGKTNTGPTNVTVNENDFGNGFTNKAFINRTTNAITAATCNWFGTIAPGSVATLISGNIIYTPYLVNGTDNDPATGFQPVPGSCNVINDLYVNDNSQVGDHYTTAVGSDVTGNGTPAAPFATIQKAINVAINGNTIWVDAGTYIENPNVTKSVTIKGSNMGIAGAASRTNAESTVQTNGAQANIFTISANNVVIDGLDMNGDDPTVTSAALASGSDANVQYAVKTNGTVNNLIVKNNIIRRVFIGVRGDNLSTGNSITANWFDEIGNYDFGYAVTLRTNFYADVTNNKMTRVWTGLHVNNHFSAGPVTWTMSGNEVHSYAAGLCYWLQYQNATGLTVSNNQFFAEAGAVANNFGILVVTNQDAVNSSFTNNSISGTEYGIGLFNVPTSNAITIGSTNIISGTTKASILFTNNLNFNPVGTTNFLAGGPGAASVVKISGPSITAASGNGIEIDASGGTATTLNIVSPTTITNGGTGLLVNGVASAITGNTINDLSFAGQTDKYVRLKNNALSGLLIDATGTLFDGTTGSAKSLVQNFATEDKILHRIDDASLGFIRVKAGNDFVTVNSFDSPNTTAPAIQRGVDANAAGETVNVGPGTFTEQVEISKDQTILGQGIGVTNIVSPATLALSFTTSAINKPIVYVHDANVVVQALTVDGNGLGNANNRMDGIAYRNAGGTINGIEIKGIRNTPIDGVQAGTGIFAQADNGTPRTLIIANNSISDFQKNGMTLAGNNLTATVNGNTVTGTGAVNFIAQNGIQLSNGATGSITNNIVSGFSYTPATATSAGILVFGAGGSVTTSNNTVNDAQSGILYYQSNGSIESNTISYNAANMGATPYWYGIDMENGTVSATQNTVDGGGNGAGIEADYVSTELTMVTATNNFVKNNDEGFVIWTDGSGGTANVLINNNSITNNTSFAIHNYGTINQNATCNWYGTANASTITSLVSGPLTYSPSLNTGTDDDLVTPGFQPVPGSCTNSPIVLSESHTNVSCFGTSTGAIDLTVSGGTFPYTYTWTRTGGGFSASTQDLSNIIAGEYSVLVMDNNGTTATLTITITQPPAIATPTVTVADHCDGTSTLTASGFTGPLTWSTGESSPSIIVNSPGTYTVTQTIGGCTSAPGSGTASPKTAPPAPSVTVVDHCDGTSTLTASGYTGTLLWSTGETSASIIVNSPGTYTVTQTVNGCTSTNGSGTAAPGNGSSLSITCPPTVNVNANTGQCYATNVHLGTPVTTGCGALVVTNNAPAQFPVGTTIVTWTVKDAGNNTRTCTQTVTVSGGIPLSISCPPNKTVSVSSGHCYATNVNLGTPVTTGCGILTVTNNAPSQFPAGTTTVTWTVKDANNNTRTCTQTVTVTGATPLSINCPANKTVNAGTGHCYATNVNLGTPSTNGCGTLTVSNDAPSQFPVGVTTVTWTVKDANNNTRTCTQTVTVVDNQNPVITCPSSLTQDAGAHCTTSVAIPDPFFSDNCNVVKLTWTMSGATSGSSPSSGINYIGTMNFNPGVTTVVYTVKDAAGHSASTSFTLTVTDNLAPSVDCPGNITQDAGNNCSKSVVVPNPAYSDNCAVTKLTWVMTGATTGSSPSSGINFIGTKTFNVGITTITYTAKDASGNSKTCSFTVTITGGTLLTISCPPNKTVSASSGHCYATNVNLGTPSTTGCGTLTITNNAPSQFPIGVTTVTWTVKDAGNNTRTCTQTMTVTGSISLSISCPPNKTVAANNGQCYATNVNLGTPTTSGCGTLTVTNNAPSQFPVGVTTVTWTVKDANNNTRTCTQTVTVTGGASLSISCPSNKTVTANNGQCYATNVNLGTPTTSGCGTLTVTNNAPSQFPVGTTTVTWTVKDANNNTRTCTQTVTVTGGASLSISCPANKTVAANPFKCYATNVNLGTPETTGCGVLTVTNNAPSQFPVGNTTVTWKVKDANNNSRTCTQTITVVDNQNPVVTCPPNMSLSASNGQCGKNINTPNPTISDNCSVAKLSWTMTGANYGSSPNSGINYVGNRYFNCGITVITYKVTDASGNTASCSFTINLLGSSNCNVTRAAIGDPRADDKPDHTIGSSKMEVSVFPNPAETYFNLRVKSQNKETVEIRVLDMLGKVVQVERGAPEQTFRLGDNIVGGMYMIEVRQAGEVSVVKVVKE